MKSPLALLFLAIQQRLNGITIGKDPVLKFIDQDLRQLDVHPGDSRPRVSWPCALIDIDDAQFMERGANTQGAVVQVCIRIGFPPYSSTDITVPAIYRNKALYYYEVEQAVILALHGWYPSKVEITPFIPGDPDARPPTEDIPPVSADISGIFGHLIRTRATRELRNDLIRVRLLTFTVSMDDFSTMPAQVFTDATYVVDDLIFVPG